MWSDQELRTEILDAYERDGNFFGVVRVTAADKTARIEFGLDKKGYVALRKILQTRPFDRTPGVPHRFFFLATVRKEPKSARDVPVTISIRIEQGRFGKHFDFDGPLSLASNLQWFDQLKDISEAAALKRLPE